jgi:hypothetical protein
MTKTTAQLIGLLIVMFTLLVASPALAHSCDKGDWKDGPNCIHQVDLPPAHGNPQTKSTVYRVNSKGTKRVVWKGYGGVIKSTVEELLIARWAVEGYEFVVETYKWDVDIKKYVYVSTQDGQDN